MYQFIHHSNDTNHQQQKFLLENSTASSILLPRSVGWPVLFIACICINILGIFSGHIHLMIKFFLIRDLLAIGCLQAGI